MDYTAGCSFSKVCCSFDASWYGIGAKRYHKKSKDETLYLYIYTYMCIKLHERIRTSKKKKKKKQANEDVYEEEVEGAEDCW